MNVPHEQIVSSDQSQVFAVVSTFCPDEKFLEHVKSVALQVKKVIIVDDGATVENKNRLNTWFQDNTDIIIVFNESNLGLATSLNKGIKQAVSLGAEWILTLDDDTLIMPDMVKKLFSNLNTLDFGGPVGLIAFSRAGSVKDTRLPWKSKRGVITSGSLFSIATFNLIKGFRDDFFIDMLDYDFCLKIRRQGLKVILLNEEGFSHSVGMPSKHKVLGRSLTAYNHAPFRRYYIVRNSFVLAWEYHFIDPLFSLAILFGLAKLLLKVCCLEDNKKIKIGYMAKGFQDALQDRLGKKVFS